MASPRKATPASPAPATPARKERREAIGVTSVQRPGGAGRPAVREGMGSGREVRDGTGTTARPPAGPRPGPGGGTGGTAIVGASVGVGADDLAAVARREGLIDAD